MQKKRVYSSSERVQQDVSYTKGPDAEDSLPVEGR